ncbi:hypothetical protein [Pseudomonas guariconensis]|uniref:hypothetical protein n=1 Tax=Pseudomonas guariconensis TaxID=1288410 RepID=UPI0018DA09E6|nr:hypothetical protein [Pseudomonas guariconensis]MBH3361360.1 hypothetical protein [Pseudomonas guariconensis]
MTIDKEKLKALAEAASARDATKVELWYLYEDLNPAAVLSLLAEIEHLQDLVAEWRRSSPVLPSRACAAIIDQLKAENEALRKDAERYRWLRDQCGIVEYKSIAGSVGRGMLPSGEKLQAAVDAAMAREASHG